MLTGRQQEIWEFLAEYVGKHGYPPTVREIGESVGLASPSTVHAHLANLERAGYLRRDPTKPRALELLRDRPDAPGAPAEVHKLPLLGSIAAGAPLLAEEHVDEYLAVPEPLSNGGEEFLLRIRGDSMINAGILDGDIVVIRRSRTRETARSSPRSSGTTSRRTRPRSSASTARAAGSGSSRRTTRSTRCTRRTSRSSARSWGSSGVSDGPDSPPSHARPGAPGARARRRAWSASSAASSSSGPGVRSHAPSAARTCAAPSKRRSPGYNPTCRPGDRERPTLEESPDTTGQNAGETPGGESRRKVAQKGDRLRRLSLRRRRR